MLVIFLSYVAYVKNACEGCKSGNEDSDKKEIWGWNRQKSREYSNRYLEHPNRMNNRGSYHRHPPNNTRLAELVSAWFSAPLRLHSQASTGAGPSRGEGYNHREQGPNEDQRLPATLSVHWYIFPCVFQRQPILRRSATTYNFSGWSWWIGVVFWSRAWWRCKARQIWVK